MQQKLKNFKVPEIVATLASLQKAIFDDDVQQFLGKHFNTDDDDSEKKKEIWIQQLTAELKRIQKAQLTTAGEDDFNLEDDWVE